MPMLFPTWYVTLVVSYLAFVSIALTIAQVTKESDEAPKSFGDLDNIEWVFGDLEEV